MKKVILPAVAIFAIFMFNSCGEKDIIGKWKIKSVEIVNLDEFVAQLEEAIGLSEDEIEELKEKLKKEMSNDFEETFIEFKPNGVFKNPSGEGKWEYDDKNKEIKIKENDSEYKIKVNKVRSKKLDFTIILEEVELNAKVAMSLERVSDDDDVEKDVIGKWEINSAEISNLDEVATQLAEDFGLGEDGIDELKEELKKEMSNNFNGTSIEFKSNGVFKSPDGEGKWEYDDPNREIKIKYDKDNIEYKLKVEKLSGKNLDFTIFMEENGIEIIMFMSLERI